MHILCGTEVTTIEFFFKSSHLRTAVVSVQIQTHTTTHAHLTHTLYINKPTTIEFYLKETRCDFSICRRICLPPSFLIERMSREGEGIIR
jgi:hypothetical protein